MEKICQELAEATNDGNVLCINIPEGKGRFLTRADGENSLFIFCMCDRKVEDWDNVDVSQDKDSIVPVIGMRIQSARKARNISRAFETLAKEMDEQEARG